MGAYTAASVRRLAKGDLHPDTPAEYIEDVLQETWGHLAPKAREVYSGHIVFTLGVHGDMTMIDWEFALADGTALDGSPWLHEDMTDFVCREIGRKGNRHGGIWRFDGTFERLKNGRSRWSGKTSPMRLQYRFPSKVRRAA